MILLHCNEKLVLYMEPVVNPGQATK